MVKRDVFLSHSGLDAMLATSLASDLKRWFEVMSGPELTVEVFNTSEPEYRFDGEGKPDARGLFRQYYTDPLHAYLSERLRSADAFLMLITPASVQAHSEWIIFELQVAAETRNEIQGHSPVGAWVEFGFACLAHGAKAEDLPGVTKAFEIEDNKEILRLADVLLETFKSR
jgi:hypothetical protein